MSIQPEQAAAEVLDVVPSITRAIREQMRQYRTMELSVTQFRVLAFLNRHPGASLSDVADHIGLALPSMSKLIDALVARKFVVREYDTVDRRRVTLAVTARGRSIMETAHSATRQFLTNRLAACDSQELEGIAAAMRVLRPLFVSPREAQRAGMNATGDSEMPAPRRKNGTT
jgi:DNA-binding MarR family transcriptional regulator